LGARSVCGRFDGGRESRVKSGPIAPICNLDVLPDVHEETCG